MKKESKIFWEGKVRKRSWKVRPVKLSRSFGEARLGALPRNADRPGRGKFLGVARGAGVRLQGAFGRCTLGKVRNPGGCKKAIWLFEAC